MEKNYRAELEEAVTRRTAELKDAMIELDSARSALLKSATDKNEFIAVISHEMLTPMNGVVGGLSLLEDEVTTVNGKEYFDIVRVSADNMVVLIDELLTFGKAVGPRSDDAASSVTIDLAAELKELVAAYQPAYDLKNISLSLCIAPDVPHEIVTFRDSLQRIIGILLGNALKFTKCGSVCLAVSHEDHEDKNARLNFSVTDSGIGIPETMLERIFEPFIKYTALLPESMEGSALVSP
jgi:signal transduction histidine kinase